MTMTRLIETALILAFTALATGCWGGGYYHTHPHICPDGKARTHKHWHADTGFAGHHEHPFPNDKHKNLAWSDESVIIK